MGISVQINNFITSKVDSNCLPTNDKASKKSQRSAQLDLGRGTVPATSDMQDSAVNISTEGTLAAQQASNETVGTVDQPSPSGSVQITSTESPLPEDTSVKKTVQSDSSSENASEDDAVGSAPALKSFTYGALGLERPEETTQNEDVSYTSGQWLKAAVSIGTLVAIFA